MKKYYKTNNQNDKVKQIYVNEKIKAFNIMLIDENWQKIWVVPRSEALKRAEQAWLDLVQVSYNPKDKISVCKIVDYGKYQYQLQKQMKEKRKQQKKAWFKEIKVSYAIWKNDLNMKVEKARKLLVDWYNVRVIIRLKWRENIFKDKAKQMLEDIEKQLVENSKSQWIKDEGKWYSLTLFSKSK